MKKNILLFIIGIISIINTFSQVKDISFTFSPLGEYSWMDNKAGLEDGTTIGGKFGFGFGEYLELRALYKESVDLKTNFDGFGMTGFDVSLFTPQNIKLTNWGGEIKANLGRGTLNPYLTVGTGIQDIKIKDGNKFEQIFTNFGLGIKTQLNDRVVFTVEGKNTLYNFDAGTNLLTASDKINFGVSDTDFSSHLISNWSAQASLQFYLSGRRPGTLSELDKAYLDKFKGGFKGLQWVIEPSTAYLNFNDNSTFRDTWMLGGYVGTDFNKYTGVRLFYFRASENDKLSTNFDKLDMYGAEFRARLNDGNGVTPFLILGGGYLNTMDGYLDKNNVPLDSENFAFAGLGLNIPLSQNFLITGGAKAMVTSSKNIENLAGPDELQRHLFYNAGIKLTFGEKSTDPSMIYESQVNQVVTSQKELSQAELKKKMEELSAKNNEKLVNLKESYTAKLDSLQKELEIAYQEKNTDKAVKILEEKKAAKTSLDEVEKVTKQSEDNVVAPKSEVKTVEKEVVKKAEAPQVEVKELIKMSPAELELLIDKILQAPPRYNFEEPQNLNLNSTEYQILNMKIDFLEKMIKGNVGQAPTVIEPVSDNSDQVLRKLDELKSQTDVNSKKIDLVNKNPIEKTVIVKDETPKVEEKTEVKKEEQPEVKNQEEGRFIKKETKSYFSDKLTYQGSSAFTGMNFGRQTTLNLGVRMNYSIQNTKLDFMTELFYGFYDSYGLSANFIYPFKALKYSSLMTPYAGLGLGFLRIDNNFKFDYNIIMGTYLKFGKGRVFADYTSRNLFKYNQIAVGYRFDF